MFVGLQQGNNLCINCYNSQTVTVKINDKESIDLPYTSYGFDQDNHFFISSVRLALKHSVLTELSQGLRLKLEDNNKLALVNNLGEYYYDYYDSSNRISKINTFNFIPKNLISRCQDQDCVDSYTYTKKYSTANRVPLIESKVILDPQDIMSNQNISNVLKELKGPPSKMLKILPGKNFLKAPERSLLNTYKNAAISTPLDDNKIGALNSIAAVFLNNKLMLFSKNTILNQAGPLNTTLSFITSTPTLKIEKFNGTDVGCIPIWYNQCLNFYALTPDEQFGMDNKNNDQSSLYPYYYRLYDLKISSDYKELEQKIKDLEEKIKDLEEKIRILQLNVTSITARPGPQGPPGDKGIPGPTGFNGTQGPKGEDGIGYEVANQFMSEMNNTRVEISNIQKVVETDKNAAANFTKKAQELQIQVTQLHRQTEAFAHRADKSKDEARQSQINTEAFSNQVKEIFCKTKPEDSVCPAHSTTRSKRTIESFDSQSINTESYHSKIKPENPVCPVHSATKSKRATEDFYIPPMTNEASRPTSFISQAITFFSPFMWGDQYKQVITFFSSFIGEDKYKIENTRQELNPTAKMNYALDVVDKFAEVLGNTALQRGISRKSLEFDPVKLYSTIVDKSFNDDELLKFLCLIAKKLCPECKQSKIFLATFRNSMQRTLANDAQHQGSFFNIEKIVDSEQPRSVITDITSLRNISEISQAVAGYLR